MKDFITLTGTNGRIMFARTSAINYMAPVTNDFENGGTFILIAGFSTVQQVKESFTDIVAWME